MAQTIVLVVIGLLIFSWLTQDKKAKPVPQKVEPLALAKEKVEEIYVSFQTRLRKRPEVCEYYGEEGRRIERAKGDGFADIGRRPFAVVQQVPGFEENPEVKKQLLGALHAYDQGEYDLARRHILSSLSLLPELLEYVFYYLVVIERVLRTQLVAVERDILNRSDHIRCKWCGHLTRRIDPNEPTFGMNVSANGCSNCGQMYASPSWIWDSPDGRAYSYYRMSFSGEGFYEEFESHYQPVPLCQKRKAEQRK